VDEGKIALNKGQFFFPFDLPFSNLIVARGNCAIKIGDLCHVSAANDIKYGKR
jgi:transitional endoplasmic reticulum ATPase